MKSILRLVTPALITLSAAAALLASVSRAAPSTGSPFYGDAPNATHPWAVHDQNRPQPKRVEPGTYSTPAQPGQPPSDAIVLFDGTAATLGKWESDAKPGVTAEPTKWVVNDGALECVPKSGFVRTKEQFGDCQLHVEWAAPVHVQGDSQGRGNSGIFLSGVIEVQVLDNYNNPTYADGFAASLYGVSPPLANALHAPGEFQVYDIVFRRPLYENGKLTDPGYVTIFCNGVLVQDHAPLEGPGGHMKRSVAGPYPEKGPLKLQDHGNPVRYRNIWYRPLPTRAIVDGSNGILSAEATTAKRAEIAAIVRADAAKLTGTPQMLRLAESLVYEKDADTAAKVDSLATSYVARVTALTGSALEAKKDEAKTVLKAFQYLARFDRLPAPSAPAAALAALVKAQGWDQEKK
jgi:hypothetical protein